MSKIRMNIAGGYLRGEIRKLIDENPQLTPTEATAQWVDSRYGSWIQTSMGTDDFTLCEVSHKGSDDNVKGSFCIVFDSPNHEDYFIRNVGGKIVPLEDTNGE